MRSAADSPLIVIPARLQATRLPNKPLADIHGRPMIVHVWQRAIAANLGPVVVAASDESIATVIRAAGGVAVLTDPDLPSGSDRVWAAVQQFDPTGTHPLIVNLQGDMPTLEPQLMHELVAGLRQSDADIATLGVFSRDPDSATNPNIVKIVLAQWGEWGEREQVRRALYFSRSALPHGSAGVVHHLGLYAYRRAALKRFVSLPEAALEKVEKLEQLRALAAGMTIAVKLVETEPFGVDTPADLDKARAVLNPS
ncbi:MAG: 3-deoxy-manno-octulosonate cytidylyltransferase [Candidatus Pacebacteria bacterium]|nr:3-deoxy-manno-octulosonate cytidylyltransferase [Candidatus Paceibacterota bacterium]